MTRVIAKAMRLGCRFGCFRPHFVFVKLDHFLERRGPCRLLDSSKTWVAPDPGTISSGPAGR